MNKRIQAKKKVRRGDRADRRGYVHHRGCATCTQGNGFMPRRRWQGQLDTRPLEALYEGWLEDTWPSK